MVFTPKQPLDLDSLGVGTSSPRAVPLDALVAAAERVVDGSLVGRFVLAAPLLAAGLGVVVLLRPRSVTAALVAGGGATWNPFVVERLALGQWALLWCYAALAWIAVAVTRARGWPGRAYLVLAVAVASVTPTGGLIAALAAIVAGLGNRRSGRGSRRDVVWTSAIAIVAQLPWIVPAALSTATATSDPAGAAAFASRGEHPGGVLLTLLGGGGIWNADVTPASRSGVLPWAGLALLGAAAVFGWRPLVDRLTPPVARALSLTAAAGLFLALASALPGSDSVMRVVVGDLPGGGLLRDGQKFVMPVVVLECLLAGAAVDRAVSRARTVQWRIVAGLAASLIPVLLLPDAAATIRPTIEPVHYPADWKAVARIMRAEGGDAAVLPFTSYRAFEWAPGRVVLDPAPRLLPVPVVVNDELAVSGHVVRGEDLRARRIGRVLEGGGGLPQGLAAAGIRWVVLEGGTPGVVADLSGLLAVYNGADVALFEVPGQIAGLKTRTRTVALVILADVLAGMMLLSALGSLTCARVRFVAIMLVATRRRRLGG